MQCDRNACLKEAYNCGAGKWFSIRNLFVFVLTMVKIDRDFAYFLPRSNLFMCWAIFEGLCLVPYVFRLVISNHKNFNSLPIKPQNSGVLVFLYALALRYSRPSALKIAAVSLITPCFSNAIWPALVFCVLILVVHCCSALSAMFPWWPLS